jgi:hypothetical protein
VSESFSEPAADDTAETDVAPNEDQVEPDADADYVGRVAGDDRGYTDEQGAEARAVEGEQ